MIDFNALPEGCIANILSLTSPRDACRSAAVSPTFRSAAESNAVWERFLPSDYQEIISRLVSPSPVSFSSKKDLYFRLCHHPIIIDHGNKSFALEKLSGKKCYMIGARDLSIIWGDTPSYWSWRSLPESRFLVVAELLRVCWLEIHGKIETQILSPGTNYAAYFVFKFAEVVYGLDSQPVEVSVKSVGGDGGGCTVYLDHDGNLRRQHQLILGYIHQSAHHRLRFPANLTQNREKQLPRTRGDGWMEIEMGEFFNNTSRDGEVQMSLMEVKSGKSKSGLII